jgi:hypothetical protein
MDYGGVRDVDGVNDFLLCLLVDFFAFVYLKRRLLSLHEMHFHT